jgi:hypothetical protein
MTFSARLIDNAKHGTKRRPRTPRGHNTPTPIEQPSSQSKRLIDLADQNKIELWHTPDGDAYATIRIDDTHSEHHRISGKIPGRGVPDWLRRLYHQQYQSAPGGQAIADALATLVGRASYDGDEHPVWVRLAARQKAVFLDLGDRERRVVEITSAGWKVASNPPVRFRRGRAMRALPVPRRGGKLDLLRELIPLATDDDWRLIVGFLLGALRGHGPYTILTVEGEAGSGKSNIARMVKRLLDPSVAELRAEPREIRDLMSAAAAGWVLALDNLSGVPPWLSDALCRLSTGGALSTRALFTDDDEHVIEAMRPVVLTGIASVITRGDLQDRAIPVILQAIPEHKRRLEAEIWARFEAIHPRVLGALCDAVAGALSREDDTEVARLPRMADWGRWVTAAEPALGWQSRTILDAYRRRTQEAIETALDGDLVALAIQNHLQMTPSTTGDTNQWTGTSAELLKQISPPSPPRGWPATPRALSAALRRLAPHLRRVGVEVRLPQGARTGRERVIRILISSQTPATQDR